MGRGAATTVRVVAVLVVAGLAAAVGYFATRAVHPARETTAMAASPTPSALRAAAATPTTTAPGAAAPLPTRAGLTRVLGGPLQVSGVGTEVRARVVDVSSGAVVFDHGGSIAAPPASVAKILTAVALLAVRAPTDRLRTSVAAGTGGAVVLVGGGDPTITGAGSKASGAYSGAARLSDLAAQLTRAKIRPTRIVVDDALFTGPAVSPSWAAEDVPSDYGAAITALTVDGGRASPRAPVRSTTPDLAAGRELAALLGRPGLTVTRASAAQAAAAASARILASVRSATLMTMITEMLHQSDNVIAETLGRQVAIAEHRPTSFLGTAASIRAVLTRLGVDPAAGFVDASGLARRDRVTPATLVAVLRLAARTPRLHALFGALAVAGWSGTLAQRYAVPAARSAAGLLRAKTGTLTGVSALAGVMHDRSGALLAFAVIADRVKSTPDAEAALDAAVARLASCGCR